MKIRATIPVIAVLTICLIAAGCASKEPAVVISEPIAIPSHHANLVMPSDSMLELAIADDFAAWEWSRNDPQLGGQPLPRDTSYRIVETRQWDVLGTSNGRPRDYSYTRIRTYSRESR